MAKKKRRSSPLGELGRTGMGLGRLGVGLGVSAAVAGRASAGTPAAGMMGGFGTIASGAGIATTAIVGKGVLGQVRKLGKKKKKKGWGY